ncbi:sigma-70 family RNA polymerase sigma factor [Paenibacillus soyae]|uniref:RNA polymerase sigma factor n=1 Tax=Paenibacillus soyae TaxID=2969249 RepID=A0A9X2MPP9_9BACL|nr:sigma-70 family RNA polymerase sigma factor [Paenibacillus soyae]MCR2803536.1 sigma-70 family RNA polymerase sigma factor [Paenibacillus soyae]
MEIRQSKTEKTSVTELVIAAAGGDMEAFAELVRLYTNAVCAVAYDLLSDYYLAQDIAQETFVKAFRSLGTLQQPERFGSWLYAIALRLSIDYKRSLTRKHRLQKELAQLALCEGERHAEDISIRDEISSDVAQALKQLDETSRTIMLSYYISEMKVNEIAGMLHMSVAAVESRMRRSRKLLKEKHLSDWAGYFRRREATDKLVGPVVERLVKQAGQYYIPVSNRDRSREWFIRVLGLTLDHNGHVMLPSGHCLFLIEVSEGVLRERGLSKLPVVVFLVEDEELFYREMEEQAVRTERESIAGTEQLFFFDPDGNKYGALAIK